MRRLVSRLILTRQEHDKEKVSAYYKSSSLFECSICLQCIYLCIGLFVWLFAGYLLFWIVEVIHVYGVAPPWGPTPYPFISIFDSNGTPFWWGLSVKAIIWSTTCPSGRPHPSNLLGTLTICRRRWRMRGEVNTRCWSLLKDIPKFLFYRRFVLYMYFSC